MTGPALLTVAELTVRTLAGATVLDAVTLELAAGESVAITGPSGAGKTTLALALLGHLREGLVHCDGNVCLLRQPLLGTGAIDPAAIAALRRREIHYVPQDPLAALTPTLRVGRLLSETVTGAAGGDRPDAPHVHAETGRLLELVGLPHDRQALRRYPHELSGGQRQRLALALALAGPPALIVLDEPTAGQDPQTRDALLTQLRTLRELTATSYVTITHDDRTAAALGDRVLQLCDGQLCPAPAATTHDTAAAAPPAATTRDTAAAAPPTATTRDTAAAAPPTATTRNAATTTPDQTQPCTTPVLAATDLHARYGLIEVLHGVDLRLHAGERVGLAGRSGSGKTTLARVLVGLHPLSGGEIQLGGVTVAAGVRRRPRQTRRKLGLIFQDPFSSLNPARRVGRILADAAGLGRGVDAQATVARMLDEVGLAETLADRRPHELSGGQQQRVAIARALAGEPRILICDEITAALDRTSRDELCELLLVLCQHRPLSLLVISHDPVVLARLAQRTLQIEHGKLLDATRAPALSDIPSNPIAT